MRQNPPCRRRWWWSHALSRKRLRPEPTRTHDEPRRLRAGDVIVQGGYPGHAVIVVDAAIDTRTGRRVYLLAQSYMPAQDMHVLVNPNDAALSPWYAIDPGRPIVTPEWRFNASHLRRFPPPR